jgi:hypothetical protein
MTEVVKTISEEFGVELHAEDNSIEVLQDNHVIGIIDLYPDGLVPYCCGGEKSFGKIQNLRVAVILIVVSQEVC